MTNNKALVLLGVTGLVLGIILLTAGLATSPTEEYSKVLNNHRLHIKNVLYFFGGVGFICFILSLLPSAIAEALIFKQRESLKGDSRSRGKDIEWEDIGIGFRKKREGVPGMDHTEKIKD